MQTTFALEMCERFNIHNGQFYAFYRYKNLQWYLDSTYIGFGDLTDDQLVQIALKLEDGERFFGMNEHHGTRFQQTDLPMVVVTREDILFRTEIVAQSKE